MADNKEMRAFIPATVPEKDLADLKNVKEQLEQLPRDSLLYIAGAVNALAADNAINQPNA